MDSCSTPDGGKKAGSQKRRREDPINVPPSRQRYYRSKETFERADPKPVAVLGPVPSIKTLIAELTQNPSALMQMMAREDAAQANGINPADPAWMEWADDEPELVSGYEVTDMVEQLPPAEPQPEASEARPEAEAHAANAPPQEVAEPLQPVPPAAPAT